MSTPTSPTGSGRLSNAAWQQPAHHHSAILPSSSKSVGGSASKPRSRNVRGRRLTDVMPFGLPDGGSAGAVVGGGGGGSAAVYPPSMSLSMSGLPAAGGGGGGGQGGGGRPRSRIFHSEGHLQSITVPPSMPPSVRDQAKNAFCKQMNAKSHDMAIIEVYFYVLSLPLSFSPPPPKPQKMHFLELPFQHFSEVVKEQQAMELHGPGEQVVPVIKLDYTQCRLFNKSTKPSTQRKKVSKKFGTK